jgi:Domain of unknown function (DUF5658)
MVDLNFFLTVGAGIGAITADSITTIVGLGANKGFIESNPLARWMFKKMGQSFACWLSGAVYIFSSLGIYSANHGAGFFYAGSIAAAEAYFAIRNYLMLRKFGIAL